VRLPGSLRARITLAAVLAVALGGVVAGAVLIAAVARDGREGVDRDLRTRAAAVLREAVRPPVDGFPGGPGARGPRDDRLLVGSGTFVQLAAGDEVVERRGDVPADPPPVPRDEGFDTVTVGSERYRSFTLVTPGPRLQVLTTLAPVDARVARIRRQIILVGLLALALVGAAAWLLTSLATRPLRRLRAGADRVSRADDPSASLPDDDGPEEVRALAGSLNGMLARLRASTEATRRFAADAGHELRTPLTGLRANLDTLSRNPDLPAAEREELLREIAAEQERMVHLLEGLQALARGDAAAAIPREDVDVAEVVDEAVYAAKRRHPDTTLTFEAPPEPATVRGWPGGLRLVADNLLDNAARHGGTHVHASVHRDDGDGHGRCIVLRVDDDGRGIAPADRDRLLEPFARGTDAGVPGTGLGLAIVAQQVALHDGQLTLGDGELGGLRAEVRLPALGGQHQVVEDGRRQPSLQQRAVDRLQG
jgi:two-component system sensor histidine kinase PrrB